MDAQKLPRWFLWFCAALVLGGLGLELYQYAGTVSNYPLTTYWSESNRIYSASLVYSLRIYGQQLQWPWLDPARSILDGLVLLLPGSQIWMFRFWLAFLSLGVTCLASIMIISRLGPISGKTLEKCGLLTAILIGWGILFFLQGPVYYHVLLGVVPVLWLFDRRKPARMLFVILAASAWEGLSRVNWFWMPAITAVLLYLLVTPVDGKKLFAYLKWPVLWLLAGASASGLTYWLFINVTHYPVVFFNPQMRYAFFSSKLWPNSAFLLGLIPGMALVSFPLLLLIAPVMIKRFRSMHWLRSLLIVGILVVFFAGSTYVSRRAGGGYDLHNYDTFMVLFFITGLYAGLGCIVWEHAEEKFTLPGFLPAFTLLLLLAVPFGFAVRNIHPAAPKLSRQQTTALLGDIQGILAKVEPSQGTVLFIDQRQLLVYGMISGVRLYQPYEKIELMEMAMANNHAYRDAFRSQIEQHAYPVIISEIHADAYQNALAPYGYENNVWFDDVSFPILKNYQLVYSNKAANIGVYTPANK